VAKVISGWFQWLNNSFGLNFTIFYDAFDGVRFWNGLLTTIELSVVATIVSVIIGIAGAGAQRSRSAALRSLAQSYVQIFRNTPPLVQMYFFFFALGPSVSRVAGAAEPVLGSFGWAVVSLSLFAGAFNVEIFRSGIEAVPAATSEAAYALGFSRLQIFFEILMPLALRAALPALTGNIINLVKTTTLASAIAAPEMLFVSTQIWSDSLNVTEMMVVLLISYNLIVSVIAVAMHRWERQLKIPGFGR
jgi:polar amino acid transport system permease protein